MHGQVAKVVARLRKGESTEPDNSVQTFSLLFPCFPPFALFPFEPPRWPSASGAVSSSTSLISILLGSLFLPNPFGPRFVWPVPFRLLPELKRQRSYKSAQLLHMGITSLRDALS